MQEKFRPSAALFKLAHYQIGRVVSPTLTTVYVPALEMGRKAGEMILARLSRNAPTAGREELVFSIIDRESTKRPIRAPNCRPGTLDVP